MKGVSDPPRVFHDLSDDASLAAVFVDLTWDEGRICSAGSTISPLAAGSPARP